MIDLPAIKAKQFLTTVFKMAALLIGGGLLYSQCTDRFFELNISHLIHLEQVSLYRYITILLLMSVLNWTLEILKWQAICSELHPLNFVTSIRQVLSSHFYAICTPAKSGEYISKASYFPKGKQHQGLGLTFIHNISQMVVTTIVGLVAGTYLLLTYQLLFEGLLPYVIYSSLVAMVFLLVLRKPLLRLAYRIKDKFSLKRRLLRQSIGYSSLRYLVFIHQFYLLLQLLGIPSISYITIMSLLATIYLVSSLIPIFQLFDVAVKGTIAVLVFQFFGVDSTPIILATLAMWLLNMLLPALLGMFFIGFSSKKLPKEVLPLNIPVSNL